MQGRDRTAPALAEDEIVADDDAGDLQARDQDLLDEGFGRSAGHRLVERQHIQQVDPERFELAHLGAQRRQPERCLLGPEPGARMGLEGQHAGRRTRAPGGLDRGADHRAVALMHPVEIADRDDRAGRLVPDVPPCPDQPHCAAGQPSRDGTLTIASPSITGSPFTMQIVSRIARHFSSLSSRTVSPRVYGVAGAHRRHEAERLAQIDRAGPRQLVGDDC